VEPKIACENQWILEDRIRENPALHIIKKSCLICAT
jgi:hypothetical protein